MTIYPLPDSVRIKLKNPIGELIENHNVNSDVLNKIFDVKSVKVAVGDATTEKLLSLNFVPDIEVVDGLEMRIKRDLPISNYVTKITVNNPPSCLTSESISAVSNALNLKFPVRILVSGEEDLFVLPILALYPFGTVVIYGQPQSGLVINHINNNNKKNAVYILNKMGIKFRNFKLVRY